MIDKQREISLKLFEVSEKVPCEHEPKHWDNKYSSCKKCGMMLQMKQ